MPKAPSNARQFFDVAKKNALGKLDKSPKGSLDLPIAGLVQSINRSADYVTTSSCSGRVVLYAAAPGGRGGRWLLVRHGTVTIAEVDAALLGSPSFDSPENNDGGATAAAPAAPAPPVAPIAPITSAESVEVCGDATPPGVVSLKVEPAILHVLCRDVAAAKRLLQVALRAGFRESGLVLSESSGKVMSQHGPAHISVSAAIALAR